MVQQDLQELQRARQLWALERFEEAIEIFERCAEENPRNPYALTDAARVSGQWFEFRKMDAYLSKLLKLNSRNAEGHLQAGMTYRMNYRPQAAKRHLMRATSTRQTAFLAELELAAIHDRAGNVDQALDHAKKALKQLPGNPEASLVLARTLNRQKKFDEALDLLAKTSDRDRPAINPDTLAASLALQARIRQGQGDDDSAFALAAKSKDVLRPMAESLPSTVVQKDDEINELFSNLSSDHITRLLEWQPSADRSNVCLMASFPRSGTTLLESMLGSHPDIVAADEIPVFTRRLVNPLIADCGGTPAEAPDRFLKLADDRLVSYRKTYLDCHAATLETELDGKLLLDKNPSLTVFMPFFLRVFPEIKLLVPLRDPRDVILSCFFQYLPVNPLSARFFNLESTAKSYAKHLGHWVELREILPEHCWHESRYEDLVDSPERELRKTLEFLGLPWNEETLSYHSNPEVKVHSAPTYAEVKETPHRKAVGRWERYSDKFMPLRSILEPVMKRLGYAW